VAKKDAKGEEKGKGGGLVGIVLVTLLALGAGAGFGIFLDGHLKQGGAAKTDDKAEAEAHPKPKPTLSSTSTLVAMNPIVVNLASPADAWIRIEASLLLEDMPIGGDALAAQLSEDLVAYLRTATLDQFEGASGFQNLREDFKDRATIRDREHIKDVIIHGVIIE
jgi:flagellar FliL protein